LILSEISRSEYSGGVLDLRSVINVMVPSSPEPPAPVPPAMDKIVSKMV
jgi:hypothetical protein